MAKIFFVLKISPNIFKYEIMLYQIMLHILCNQVFVDPRDFSFVLRIRDKVLIIR